MRWSDGASPRQTVPGKQGYQRADDGGDDRGGVNTGRPVPTGDHARDKAADNGADDAQHHGAQYATPGRTGEDDVCDNACDDPNDDPRENSHGRYLLVRLTSACS